MSSAQLNVGKVVALPKVHTAAVRYDQTDNTHGGSIIVKTVMLRPEEAIRRDGIPASFVNSKPPFAVAQRYYITDLDRPAKARVIQLRFDKAGSLLSVLCEMGAGKKRVRQFIRPQDLFLTLDDAKLFLAEKKKAFTFAVGDLVRTTDGIEAVVCPQPFQNAAEYKGRILIQPLGRKYFVTKTQIKKAASSPLDRYVGASVPAIGTKVWTYIVADGDVPRSISGYVVARSMHSVTISITDFRNTTVLSVMLHNLFRRKPTVKQLAAMVAMDKGNHERDAKAAKEIILV